MTECVIALLLINNEPVKCWDGNRWMNVQKKVCSKPYEEVVTYSHEFYPVWIEDKIVWECKK